MTASEFSGLDSPTGLLPSGWVSKMALLVSKELARLHLHSHITVIQVEREIAMMKLIDHPHVLGLYDVYENNTHL